MKGQPTPATLETFKMSELITNDSQSNDVGPQRRAAQLALVVTGILQRRRCTWKINIQTRINIRLMSV